MFTDIAVYTEQMSKDEAVEMEDKLKAKFLSYPIPAAIVEAWEKAESGK